MSLLIKASVSITAELRDWPFPFEKVDSHDWCSGDYVAVEVLPRSSLTEQSEPPSGRTCTPLKGAQLLGTLRPYRGGSQAHGCGALARHTIIQGFGSGLHLRRHRRGPAHHCGIPRRLKGGDWTTPVADGGYRREGCIVRGRRVPSGASQRSGAGPDALGTCRLHDSRGLGAEGRSRGGACLQRAGRGRACARTRWVRRTQPHGRLHVRQPPATSEPGRRSSST